jgi:hypothetical protein
MHYEMLWPAPCCHLAQQTHSYRRQDEFGKVCSKQNDCLVSLKIGANKLHDEPEELALAC